MTNISLLGQGSSFARCPSGSHFKTSWLISLHVLSFWKWLDSMHGDYFQIYTALQWQQQKQGEQQLNKSSCEVISSIQVDLSEVYLEEIQESEKTKKQEQKQENAVKKRYKKTKSISICWVMGP